MLSHMPDIEQVNSCRYRGTVEGENMRTIRWREGYRYIIVTVTFRPLNLLKST